jgi:flavodoxin
VIEDYVYTSKLAERRSASMRTSVHEKVQKPILVAIVVSLALFHLAKLPITEAVEQPISPAAVSADKGAQSLVVYYSRSGKTRLVANELASQLSCDLREIRSKKKRDGIGVINCVLDSLLDRDDSTAIFEKDLGGYDSIIVATPIWVSKLSSPARAFIKGAGLQGKRVCLIITYNGDLPEEKEAEILTELESEGVDLQGFYKIMTKEKTEGDIRKEARAVSGQLACRGKGRK